MANVGLYFILLYFCPTFGVQFNPKERVICAASFEERVIHHAVMNVCAPHFENHQLPHSYACRKGKGTFAAIETARLHQRKYQWFLKLDVRKYFDSVDHETLKSLMCRMYKDKRLLQLFDRLIDSYHTRSGKGLPIGNLSSQYFANHYLAQADKYLIHTLGMKNYVRYMDDMLLWDNDRHRLQYVKECLDDFLTARLQLTLKPPVLNRSEHGLTALGFRIYPHAMSLNRRSRDRFALKIRTYIGALHTGELDYGSFMRRIWALYGFVGHATYKGFAGKVMREMETG